MISVGKFRWPLTLGLPLLVGTALFFGGMIHLHYKGQTLLSFSGTPRQMDQEFNILQAHPKAQIRYAKVPGHPLDLIVLAEAPHPQEVMLLLTTVSTFCLEQSLANRKAEFLQSMEGLQKQKIDAETRFKKLASQQKASVVVVAKRMPSKADLESKIQELKNRRRLLIRQYPSDTDIPQLAKQIQDLQNQLDAKPVPVARKNPDLSRQINEAKIRLGYFSRQLEQTMRKERLIKPGWKIIEPIQKPKWPFRADGWPLASGIVAVVLILGIVLLKDQRSAIRNAAFNGLWRPAAEVPDAAPEGPVELKVVPTESETLPSDPLTEKAAELYAKWVETAKVLYAPSNNPPQGILDQVTPLLQETSDFLPKGHDVLARYLARSVTPGDLAAHVARTVLMTLSGAHEAGVSPEHRLAVALAALFHDLAVVPRPAAQQEEVGSEVGRLSASVLRRIPGLAPALLSMVEDILVGMDEFKLDTWQNSATGKNLEPLSKVLREIDRFEKVMQKQKSRLDRQITRHAANS